jgi:hypothetical protein
MYFLHYPVLYLVISTNTLSHVLYVCTYFRSWHSSTGWWCGTTLPNVWARDAPPTNASSTIKWPWTEPEPSGRWRRTANSSSWSENTRVMVTFPSTKWVQFSSHISAASYVTYFSSHINGQLVSRQREWRWFHCCISIREHAKLHLMLHTSVAISMDSLSQDKENDVGFIVVSQLGNTLSYILCYILQ